MAMFSVVSWARSFCFMQACFFLYASMDFIFLVVLGCSFQMCAAIYLTLLSYLVSVGLQLVTNIIGGPCILVFLIALLMYGLVGLALPTK